MSRHRHAVVAAAFATLALVATVSAHSGSITTAKDCEHGEVHVYLHNNVTKDRLVTVTSTIPGHPGTSGHFDTTGATGDTAIWSASGPQPFAGTVTLTIGQEFTTSVTVTPAGDCEQPTPKPTPRPTPTPTPLAVHGTPAPHLTLPPTDTGATASERLDQGAVLLVVLLIAAAASVSFVVSERGRK